MTITSLAFAVFCALAILVYWRLPQRFRTGWLFAVSTAFIVTWSWELAGIFLVVATVNFTLGKWLAIAERRQRILLWIGIGFNVLVLLALKYSGFYISPLADLLARLGFRAGTGGLALLVPIGLSFIVVQMISYLVDISHRLLVPEARWLDFALYVVYFPKVLSGPIERARLLLPMFRQPKPLDAQTSQRYFWLIVMGLFRKLVIADTLSAMIPGTLFQSPANYAAQDLAVYLLAYAFVIYNDFAGYTSIARGVSGFFGIELTSNFNLPYFSRNIAEFWERWHISLSNWLRDYIFFPLSRALRKRIPNPDHVVNLAIPPVVTMLVSGAWHGLAPNFLVWGLLHGVYLMVGRISVQWSPRKLPGEFPKWRQVLSALGLFALVTLTWIPFRMDLATAWQYLSRMFTPSAWAKPDLWLLQRYLAGNATVNNWSVFHLPDIRVFILVIGVLLFDWLQARRKDEAFLIHWPAWASALFLMVLGLAIFLFSLAETGAPFVYQGF